MTKEELIITGNDAKNFILKREKQIKDIDNRTTTTNKKKRLKLINDYKSVEKLMEEKIMTASEAKKLSTASENANCWESISENTKKEIIKSCEREKCYCIVEPSNDFESNDKPKLEYLGYKVAIISNKWNEYCYIISWC